MDIPGPGFVSMSPDLLNLEEITDAAVYGLKAPFLSDDDVTEMLSLNVPQFMIDNTVFCSWNSSSITVIKFSSSKITALKTF